jgi:hypothetical protein
MYQRTVFLLKKKWVKMHRSVVAAVGAEVASFRMLLLLPLLSKVRQFGVQIEVESRGRPMGTKPGAVQWRAAATGVVRSAAPASPSCALGPTPGYMVQ